MSRTTDTGREFQNLDPPIEKAHPPNTVLLVDKPEQWQSDDLAEQ